MTDIIGAHLVGSAPVDDAALWFDLAAGQVGSQLRRIGDGETEERDAWIRWQHPRLQQSPQLRLDDFDRCPRRVVSSLDA